MAWTDHINTVQKLYVAYYQRPADPAGLRYWAQVIQDFGIKAAVNGFVNSSEAQSLYSGDITAVINAVYNSAFGRAPESGGVQYWTNVYNQGWATLGSIVWEIVNGAKGSDAIVLSNKVTSAMNFTQALDPELDGIGPFQATYSGDADAVAGRAFLASVNATTVHSLDAARAYIITNIADSGDPISGSTTGNVFNFVWTAAAPQEDKLVGTPFDDLFIGTSNTVQVGDRADGLKGNDTLRLLGFTGAVVIPLISNIETVEVVGNPTTVNLLQFTDVQTLRIRDIAKMNTNINATLANNQTVELVNIANAATQTINIFTNLAGDKTIDVVVDNVVQKVVTTPTQKVTPINLNVAWIDATTLNLTAQNKASDITINFATGAGLQAGDTLNILGTADITVTFDNKEFPNGLWINASQHNGEATLRLVGVGGAANKVNYNPANDNFIKGIDKIVLFDTLTAGTNILNLSAQTESFTVIGSPSKDKITGGAGADTISAGKGNDIINGGVGADTLTGGAGADRFIFANFATADKITDFATGADSIRIDIEKVGTNGVGTIRLTAGLTKVKLVNTMGATAKYAINLGTAGASLTANRLFVNANYAKLVTAITMAANTGANDDRVIALGRTTAQNKLYLFLLNDTNTGMAGGAYISKVFTIATVGANFAATDIFIF